MKPLFSIFLTVFCLFAFGQNRRFVYEYRFASDSLQKDSVQTEWMLLDITAAGSKYFSKGVADRDSFVLSMMQKNPDLEIYDSGIRPKIADMVEKKYPDYQIYLLTSLGDSYRVLDKRPILWKILPQKEKIGGWETQKATTEFAGRSWNAWFTTEIPVPDGPYKFYGLPGLIVKLESADQSHVFNLSGIQKLPEGNSDPVLTWNDFENAILLDQSRFSKQKEKYEKDRNAHLRETIMRAGKSGQSVNVVVDGTSMKPAEALHYLDLKNQKEKECNNNPLELDLN